MISFILYTKSPSIRAVLPLNTLVMKDSKAHKEFVDHFGYFRGLNMSLSGIFRLLKKGAFWSFLAPNNAFSWLKQVPENQLFGYFRLLI